MKTASNSAAAAAACCIAFCYGGPNALTKAESGADARPLPSTRCAFVTPDVLRGRPSFSKSRHGRRTDPERPAIHPIILSNESQDQDWDPAADPAILPPGAPTDSEVESTTLKWIRRSVIGLNLCPFAERPIKLRQLSTHVVRGDDHATIAEAVSTQLLSKRDEIGTALVVAPEYYPDDFERYMSMVQFLEQRVMEYHELHGDVQIAPFHPLFSFDGTGDNVDHYTNRSPYPMFHVLRKDEVSSAVEKLGGDPGKVWRRNVRLLENLERKVGREVVVKILLGKGEMDAEDGSDKERQHQQQVVEEVLKQTKIEMEEEEEGGEKKTIRGLWIR